MWISENEFNKRILAAETQGYMQAVKADSPARPVSKYRTALQNVIDAAFQSYGDDIDKFISDLAVWKDSVERQEALERLNGLNAEQLIRTFNLEDFTTEEEDEDGDL